MKVLLTLFNSLVALTAIIGGLILIQSPLGESIHLPSDLLQKTPFSDYRIPGIILTCVVGGSNLLATVFLISHRLRAYDWSIAGGIILMGWICVQGLLIGMDSWLQIFYLFLGMAIALLTWQLKGRWAA